MYGHAHTWIHRPMPSRQSFLPATARARRANASNAQIPCLLHEIFFTNCRPTPKEERKNALIMLTSRKAVWPGKGWKERGPGPVVLCAHAQSRRLGWEYAHLCCATRRLCNLPLSPFRPAVWSSAPSFRSSLEGLRTARSIACVYI